VSWPPFHPAARKEFDAAFEQLAEQSPALALRFLENTQATIRLLRDHPDAGRPIGRLARRFPIRPFRYQLVYVRGEGDIRVIAIAHERRRPEYWRPRR
jgi:toxin ParE1/3/4